MPYLICPFIVCSNHLFFVQIGFFSISKKAFAWLPGWNALLNSVCNKLARPCISNRQWNETEQDAVELPSILSCEVFQFPSLWQRLFVNNFKFLLNWWQPCEFNIDGVLAWSSARTGLVEITRKNFLSCLYGQTTLSNYTLASQRERQLLCYSKVFSLSMSTFWEILSHTTKRKK